MPLSQRDVEQTTPIMRSFATFRSRLHLTPGWPALWRLVMAFLMVTTFVVGMWAGIASQAAVAYAMSQEEAQFLHHSPPVSKQPRRASRIHPASIALCPALTGTPNVGGTGDDNGLGILSFYTLVKQSLSDQVSLAENVANGNVVLQSSDLTIHGTGLNLSITSTYNSQSTASGTLGNGWNLSVGNGVTLTASGDNYILNGPSGYSATYEANENSWGDYEEPPGLDATLLASNINGATHVIEFQHTSECLGFNSNGYEIFDEDRNGNQITFTYNNSNQLKAITDTQGRLTTLTYDSAGHVKTITDPIGRTVQYNYDSVGDLLTITNMTSQVYTFGYSSGVLTSITDPDSQKTSISYQSGNMITGLTDATNATTSFAYYEGDDDHCTDVNESSNLPCTVVTVTPNTTPENTTYLYSGTDVEYVQDANGNMESTTYTPDANVATYTDPLFDQTVYNYNSNNTLAQATDANGAVTSFDYDNSNPYQPNKETNPQGDELSFSYDSNGNLTKVQDTTSGGTGTTVSYTYNSNGTLATSADGDGNTTSYSYDQYGNLTKVTPPSPLKPIKYTVDGVSRIQTITDGKGQLTTFTLTDASLFNSNNQEIDDFLYTYDKAGNRTQFQETGASTTVNYSYNAAEELASSTQGSKTTTYSYDANGNLTGSSTGPAYSYNPKNQTTSIGTDNYTYTGTDQTERVQVNSVSYEYSGLGLSAKTNSSGTDYYTRCSCGMLIGERTNTGKDYYYLLDAQESVVGVMDSSGNLVNGYVYDPFGNLFEQNETVANPWQYASGYLDSTTGLYHFGARYYDPTLGRWTQEDPIGGNAADPDSLNPYLYVTDNPVNAVDPGGKFEIEPILYLFLGTIPIPVGVVIELTEQEAQEVASGSGLTIATILQGYIPAGMETSAFELYVKILEKAEECGSLGIKIYFYFSTAFDVICNVESPGDSP